MANPKGNPQNLIQNQPKEKQPSPKQARKNSSKGGKQSAANKKARKTLKEELLLLLEKGDVQERMCLALIHEASGDNGGSVVRAFQAILEAIGEKPRAEIEIGNLDDKPFEQLDLSKLTDEQLQAILAKK